MSVQGLRVAAIVALFAGVGTSAVGQTVNAPPAWVSGGYNSAFAATSQPYQGGGAANGNTLVVNGELQSSNSVSIASQFATLSGGAGVGGVGAGYATSTAVGNLLNIQVTGSGDTVIVTSSQTNTGTQIASTHP
jgi:hypothetical protein